MISSKALPETLLAIANKDTGEAGVEKFMNYLTEKNLLGLLPQILRHVERLSHSNAATDTLHIYAPYALGKSDLDELVRVAGAQDAHKEEHIDKSLVGGFSATAHGRQGRILGPHDGQPASSRHGHNCIREKYGYNNK